MPDWWRQAFHSDQHLETAVLALRLGMALLLGGVVAIVFRLTHGKPGGQSIPMMATLVMLTVLIAMVTLVIGESQARAFSLVGALAIIRFRTVVEDTRDTAFVIFAVAVGMAVASGYLLIAILGIAFATIAAFLIRSWKRPAVLDSVGHVLTLRVGSGHSPEDLLREPLGKHFDRSQLIATSTARSGAALELSYLVRLREGGSALDTLAELNKIPGIQQVEMKMTGFSS